jgi:hypothetical protein
LTIIFLDPLLDCRFVNVEVDDVAIYLRFLTTNILCILNVSAKLVRSIAAAVSRLRAAAFVGAWKFLPILS